MNSNIYVMKKDRNKDLKNPTEHSGNILALGVRLASFEFVDHFVAVNSH